jgi:site-specific DNA-methyltransferase (adenine-specific)
MPNTFSMSPGYIASYVAQHQLKRPDVDVLRILQRRLTRFAPPEQGEYSRGKAWLQDATSRNKGPVSRHPAKLIFTSPPYLEVMKYGKLNWIRLWFLGLTPTEVDGQLFSSGSVDRYMGFIRPAIRRMREVLRDDGYIALVLGDVSRPDRDIELGSHVAKAGIEGTDLALLATVVDELPTEHKVSRIWGGRRGQATKVDRIVILGGPAAAPLSTPPMIDWVRQGLATS